MTTSSASPLSSADELDALGDRVDPYEVADRVGRLRERLAAAGGDRVKVVAVTKGFGPDAVVAAVSAGLEDIGENYAQELLSKAEVVAADVAAGVAGSSFCWHFIGRLQRNKVRKIAGLVQVWQSVDRIELVDEIARRAPGARVFVQVDIAETPGRGGCPPAQTAGLVERCRQGGLEVGGLMAVGRPGSAEQARPGFRMLAAQAADMGLTELSMGMSGDLEVAVEEGATMVRVGTDLFGPRPS